MKTIIFILSFFALSNFVHSQRIFNLTDEPNPSKTSYMLIDRSSYAAPRRVSVQNLFGLYTIPYRYKLDTIEKFAGLDTNGKFVTPTGHYINTSNFTAFHLAANVKNSTMILDSELYKFEVGTYRWTAGVGLHSVKQVDEPGRANYATGASSLACNDSTIAFGNNSSSFGQYTVAAGINSFSMGLDAVAPYPESFAQAGGLASLSKKGGAQNIRVVGWCETVGTVADTIRINNTTNFTIATDMVAYVRVNIVAVQTGGSSGTIGDSFCQTWQGGIANKAGTTALLGAGFFSDAARNDAAFAGVVTGITANDVNESLVIKVTGEANKNIRWVATLDITMVGFRNFNLGY